MYNFAFMSKDELSEDRQKNPGHFWFEVADVLKFQKLSDVNNYIFKSIQIKHTFSLICDVNLREKNSSEGNITWKAFMFQLQSGLLRLGLY